MTTVGHYRASTSLPICTGISTGHAESMRIQRHLSVLTCTSFYLFQLFCKRCVLIEASEGFCGLSMSIFEWMISGSTSASEVSDHCIIFL